ncbi:hypothetical protein H8B15_18360 [Hymenobacter sp. BT507]|uniref:phosphoribosylanthranilate isomerase n=1 Tax=Hymenobacter citatus TaxID=2763506 RepID=A0ABR7MP97_9BACT|nr:hypothetical protein [Hymenobacter citatus]MBC6612892.1 hypothetical protein [Hymenobacter citatus]
MLRIPVLVRGINNLSDARYCAGMGADGLIFTLDPTLPGAVTPTLMGELAGWVAGVKLLGEFDAQPVSEINRLVEECGLQEVLLHQLPTTPLSVASLLTVNLADSLSGAQREEMAQQYSTIFPTGFGVVVVLDSPELDLTTQQQLAEAAVRFPLWLSGAITPSNVLPLLDTVQPAGFILSGGDEIKPGLRDFTELEAVFEALEE